MAIATNQITIVDLHDISISSAAPSGAALVVDALWFDTSITPPALKKYNGTQWISANISPTEYQNLLDTISGTTNYRTTGPPTNNPVPTGVNTIANDDGSMDLKISWDQYAQGDAQADDIVIIWKKGVAPLGAPTLLDNVEYTNVNTSGPSYYIIPGVNPADNFSVGIAASRRTENGREIGTIISLGSMQDVTGGSSNFSGFLGDPQTSKGLELNSNGYIRSGKTSFIDAQPGFWLGKDANNYPSIHIGNSSSWLRWSSASGTLDINGKIIVAPNSSGFANLDAPANVKALTGSESINNANQQWSDVSGTGRPEDNATVGAPSGTYVGSTLAQTVESLAARAASGLDTSGYVKKIIKGVNLPTTGMSAGLNITGNYLGYHDGISWKSYLDSSGNFKFGDGINGPGIAWNQSAGTLGIRGSLVADDIKSGTLDASLIDVNNLDASSIITGTLDSSKVNVTNINADNIVSGYISGERINAGTISTEKFTVDAGGPFFSEKWSTISSLTNWTNKSGNGEIAWNSTGGYSGGPYITIGNNSGTDDMAWYIYNTNIPFDPTKLYRIRCTARRTAGSGNIYIGWIGVQADGTTVVSSTGSTATTGIIGSSHYHAAYASAIGPTWKEYVGHTKGYGATTGTTGWSGAGFPVSTPGTMHPTVRYLRPLIVVNHPSVIGSTDIDSFVVEILPATQTRIDENGIYVGPGSQAAAVPTWNVTGSCSVINASTIKKTGASAWDSQVYSSEGYKTCYISFTAPSTSMAFMISLNSDPSTDASYTSLDYAWYPTAGGMGNIYENGNANPGSYTPIAYTSSTVFSIVYDGINIKYYQDGVLRRTVYDPGKTFYFDSSFYTQNAMATNIRFGEGIPSTTLITSGGIYTGSIMADQITAGTITGRTLQTAALGKRTAIYASDYSDANLAGEIHIWDDLGAGLEEIASVGVNQGTGASTDYYVAKFGSFSAGNNKGGAYGMSNSSYGLLGQSNSNAGVLGYSGSSYGLYGISESSNGVYGIGWIAGVYGKGAGPANFGTAGGYGVIAESPGGNRRAALRLIPATAPPDVAHPGAIYFDSTANRFYGYNNTGWVILG